MKGTDVRTELGARVDAPTLLADKPLILYGRAAWAHDFVGTPAFSAAFRSTAGQRLHDQRRADPARYRARHDRRAMASSRRLVAERHLQWRFRARLADLQRKRQAALFVVRKARSDRARLLESRAHFQSSFGFLDPGDILASLMR